MRDFAIMAKSLCVDVTPEMVYAHEYLTARNYEFLVHYGVFNAEGLAVTDYIDYLEDTIAG